MSTIKLSFTDESLAMNEVAVAWLKKCEDELNASVDMDRMVEDTMVFGVGCATKSVAEIWDDYEMQQEGVLKGIAVRMLPRNIRTAFADKSQ